MVSYFETNMIFGELLYGFSKYDIPTSQYCILLLHTDITLVGTTSELLIERFSKNEKFQRIELTTDDLYFKMADRPVKEKSGNPNLMPFI